MPAQMFLVQMTKTLHLQCISTFSFNQGANLVMYFSKKNYNPGLGYGVIEQGIWKLSDLVWWDWFKIMHPVANGLVIEYFCIYNDTDCKIW